MNLDEIIMRASAIKLLANTGDKQAIFDECNRIITICEAAQPSAERTDGAHEHKPVDIPGMNIYCEVCGELLVRR